MEKQTRVKFGIMIHNTEVILDYTHSNVWRTTKTTSGVVNTILLLLSMTFPEKFGCML